MSLVAQSACKFGKQRRTGTVAEPRSTAFGQIFELHWALEEAVSTAAKDGIEISPADIIPRLLIDNPQPEVSEAHMYKALIEAAARAGVKVRSN